MFKRPQPKPQRCRGAVRSAAENVAERVRMKLSETDKPSTELTGPIGRFYRVNAAGRRFRSNPSAGTKWFALTHRGWVWNGHCLKCSHVLSEDEHAQLDALLRSYPL